MKNGSPMKSLIVAAALLLPTVAWAQFVSVSTPAMTGGRPVVITTPLASGHMQTVSFLPSSGPLSQAAAARAIERAQSDLALRGIHRPTALQIGITLLGGVLPTPQGDVQVPGILPKGRGKAQAQMQVQYTGPFV